MQSPLSDEYLTLEEIQPDTSVRSPRKLADLFNSSDEEEEGAPGENVVANRRGKPRATVPKKKYKKKTKIPKIKSIGGTTSNPQLKDTINSIKDLVNMSEAMDQSDLNLDKEGEDETLARDPQRDVPPGLEGKKLEMNFIPREYSFSALESKIKSGERFGQVITKSGTIPEDFVDNDLTGHTFPKLSYPNLKVETACQLLDYTHSSSNKGTTLAYLVDILCIIAYNCLVTVNGESVFRDITPIWKEDSDSKGHVKEVLDIMQVFHDDEQLKRHGDQVTTVLKDMINDMEAHRKGTKVGHFMSVFNDFGLEATKSYIGAYTMNHIRLLVKDRVNIVNHMTFNTKTQEIPFIKSYTSLYGRTNMHGLRPPMYPPTWLASMNSMYQRECTAGTTLAFYVCHRIRSTGYEEERSILRAFGAMTLEEFGLPIYVWIARIATMFSATAVEVICALQGPLTSHSFIHIIHFMARYVLNDEDRIGICNALGIPEVPPANSRYWPVARLAKRAYNSHVGRRGNEAIMTLMIYITGYMQPKDKNNVLYQAKIGRLRMPDFNGDHEELMHSAVTISKYFSAKVSAGQRSEARGPVPTDNQKKESASAFDLINKTLAAHVKELQVKEVENTAQYNPAEPDVEMAEVASEENNLNKPEDIPQDWA